jgi:hypothetical protein
MAVAINNVIVEDEARMKLRELVADPIVLDPLLRLAETHTSFVCLRLVDAYGDTVFNRRQAEQVVRELDRLAAYATSPQQHSVLKELTGLALFCCERPHRYLRFEGD